MATDKKYLQSAYSSFVNSAIQRVARSGDQVYHFNIPSEELREAFGVQRLRPESLAEVRGFFERKGASVDYTKGEGFEIHLDLNRASLTPSEAEHLAIALEVEAAG
ncbi:hypothetical protein D9X30_4635 (plasmid) [Cupriavidus sp. U2]|uniref:hypothetical protein n=1 Tax=Cupriavidus sp. U2 TaxID=2920269 RepID=UPI00129D80C5|nr:hypothetical protein [Cupriavidus sp. U2]KAI3590402.1 hypothetical protein D9X30_4635 [Cupriavidus sp. U2]